MNILIVEDNVNDRRLLRVTLEHHGCKVIEARDGREGLEAAIRHRPDVIVSDALMPRMDGFQLLRAIRESPDLRSIPFLFYSATYTRADEERLAFSLGADSFLCKPTEPEVFWERICEVVKAREGREEPPVMRELIEGEEEYLAEYSLIVAKKLEEKVLELEKAMARNEEAEKELRRINAELAMEIEERKKAEDSLKSSLREKEVLLKEIHHRVKNNLQIISSLLGLQFEGIDDEEALRAMRSSQDRLKSMALVHENLYLSKDLGSIDLAGYVESLTDYLHHSCLEYGKHVSVIQDVGEVRLTTEKAIPCGLIINELVSNSLKHGFPEGRKGEVTIHLHADDQGMVTLTVADDGVGLPPGTDFRNTRTMGLQLVNMLTRQLHGEVSLLEGEGTTFTVRFKG